MRRIYLMILVMLLLISGCYKENEGSDVQTEHPTSSGVGYPNDQTKRPTLTDNIDTETKPPSEYGMISGESPVPETRVGYVRAGTHAVDHAVSPSGIYFIEKPSDSSDASFIIYADHGSDIFIKLCGRPDCIHSGPDCNAYVHKGSDICYYDGFLYVISGEGSYTEECSLIRMDSDGSNHVTVLDLTSYAKENNGNSVVCDRITEGACLFSIYRWEKTATDASGSYSLNSYHAGYHYYMLDGSMDEPVEAHTGGMVCYSCGDVYLTYFPESVNGGALGSYWDWDPVNNEATFLTDHPGEPGWFGEEQGFYFMDGAIHRLTYATRTDEIMVDTGLEGDYYAMFFPDCVVVASNEWGSSDKYLYIYDWSFRLLDTVRVNVSKNTRTQDILIAETADRLILSDSTGSKPKYYIEKSDFSTGKLEVHEFEFL